MLLYHPAFDIHHCVFRLLRILEQTPTSTLEIERVRVLDFYLLFPQLLQKFRFPDSIRGKKKELKGVPNPYEEVSDPKRIFFRLEPFQATALKTLAAYGFIEANLLKQGKIRRTKTELPKNLAAAIGQANASAPKLVEFLTTDLSNIDLYGQSGLKARSDLFQYRYDAISTTAKS